MTEAKQARPKRRGRPPRGKLAHPCRHCRRRERCRGRGLCAVCYELPGVRDTYPDGRKLRKQGGEDCWFKNPPKRRPGQAAWRCLWCSKFRCDGPLRKCAGCTKIYLERMATMPEPGEE